MKVNDIITEEQIDEIDRRGFLRGIGAAGAAVAVPGLVKAQNISPKLKDAVQKFVSIIKNKIPDSTIIKITFVKFSENVEHKQAAGKMLLVAEGKFHNDNIAVTSPTGNLGFSSGIVNNQTAKLNNPWEVIFGSNWLKMNLFGGNGKPLGDHDATIINVPVESHPEKDKSYPLEFGSISVKGIRMGMTKDEVKEITGKTDDVFGFTLANEKFDIMSFSYHDNRLMKILLSVDTFTSYNQRFNLSNVIEAIQGKYGPGKINTQIIRNKAGNQFEGIEAIWNIPDGSSIMLWSHAGKIGKIIISFNSPISLKNLEKQSAERKAARNSDL